MPHELNDPNTHPLRRVVLELSGVSERAAVLLLGAMLDRKLEMLLRAHFTKMSGSSETEINFLLTKRPLPPLGSFGIRARIAHVLGLISRPMLKSICDFADIRNAFAHHELPEPLTIGRIQPLFNGVPQDIRDAFEPLVNEVTDKNGVTDVRGLLMWAQRLISMGVERELNHYRLEAGRFEENRGYGLKSYAHDLGI